ncbi:MAG: flavodoxin-dependent (E)-4-hydroxy-3-methylbut-2-enyl-diphosphate synthase [Eggerthellaceae bacterium]
MVADIHFDALRHRGGPSRRGSCASTRRIGGWEKTDAVIEAARRAGIPIRVGVNAGSLDEGLKAREDLTLPEKLAASAVDYVRHFEERGFHDVVVSAKAHDVMTTVKTYRMLAKEIPEVPLHIGITEAGTLMQGVIKSASGLGILLEEGIGDTMRISLTDEPTAEIRACWMLLAALDLRRRGPEIISCPTCGRCQVDLIDLAKRVDERLAACTAPIKVAVMGCVVNGPGEAADADLGVACGAGGVMSKEKSCARLTSCIGSLADRKFEIEDRHQA